MTTRGPPMTVSEYMSPVVFPLTTQPGISVQQQLWTDAMAYDGFDGDYPPPTREAAAKFAELKRKIAAWDDPQLDAELKAAKAAERARGIQFPPAI